MCTFLAVQSLPKSKQKMIDVYFGNLALMRTIIMLAFVSDHCLSSKFIEFTTSTPTTDKCLEHWYDHFLIHPSHVRRVPCSHNSLLQETSGARDLAGTTLAACLICPLQHYPFPHDTRRIPDNPPDMTNRYCMLTPSLLLQAELSRFAKRHLDRKPGTERWWQACPEAPPVLC